MNTEDIPKVPYEPWVPISNPRDLKTLGKLSEECGELIAAISRCTIQGMEELEPVSKKPNFLWLQEEIADVQANIDLVIERFILSPDAILNRKNKKIVLLDAWHRQLK